MTFLKTKRVATIVLAIAVVFGIAFGTYRSTMAERKKVEQYYKSDIAELVQLHTDAAYNLVSMGNKVGADTSALAALCAQTYQATDFDDVCQVQTKMAASRPSFDAIELTDADQATIRSLEQQMDNWLLAMKSSTGFTENVDRFNNQVYGPLAPLFGIQKLTVWGGRS